MNSNRLARKAKHEISINEKRGCEKPPKNGTNAEHSRQKRQKNRTGYKAY